MSLNTLRFDKAELLHIVSHALLSSETKPVQGIAQHLVGDAPLDEILKIPSVSLRWDDGVYFTSNGLIGGVPWPHEARALAYGYDPATNPTWEQDSYWIYNGRPGEMRWDVGWFAPYALPSHTNRTVLLTFDEGRIVFS